MDPSDIRQKHQNAYKPPTKISVISAIPTATPVPQTLGQHRAPEGTRGHWAGLEAEEQVCSFDRLVRKIRGMCKSAPSGLQRAALDNSIDWVSKSFKVLCPQGRERRGGAVGRGCPSRPRGCSWCRGGGGGGGGAAVGPGRPWPRPLLMAELYTGRCVPVSHL